LAYSIIRQNFRYGILLRKHVSDKTLLSPNILYCKTIILAYKARLLIDAKIKELLGFDIDTPDKKVLAAWKAASSRVCKPCWELKYCPYGPFVEESPLLPPLREEMVKEIKYLKNCLKTGKMADGKPLDVKRKKIFQDEIDGFKPEDYPEKIPQEILESSCNVFGHICPVVFVAEGFTETSENRRTGRYIPFKVKMRVARRDNYVCQECKHQLLDDELEFDHIIPVSKGGSSEEHNIRLTCYDCNRDKLDRVDL